MQPEQPIPPPHRELLTSRRDFLLRGGGGFGALALTYLLSQESQGAAARPAPVGPLAPRPGHFPARAKSAIFLFMEGGPSHLDLFDPKPKLNELAGQVLPDSFGTVITPMGESRSPLLPSRRTWRRYGRGGTWVSDWL